MKAFRIVTLLSMIITLTVAVASLMGLAITGFYPGMVVLVFLTLIPVVSVFYAKKISGKSNDFQRSFYKTAILINILTIGVAIWMTFVILVDRVFGILL